MNCVIKSYTMNNVAVNLLDLDCDTSVSKDRAGPDKSCERLCGQSKPCLQFCSGICADQRTGTMFIRLPGPGKSIYYYHHDS